jgi:hypothetical protein
MASSKLFVEEAMISVTFATDMLVSFGLLGNRYQAVLQPDKQDYSDSHQWQEQDRQLWQAPTLGKFASSRPVS